MPTASHPTPAPGCGYVILQPDSQKQIDHSPWNIFKHSNTTTQTMKKVTDFFSLFCIRHSSSGTYGFLSTPLPERGMPADEGIWCHSIQQFEAQSWSWIWKVRESLENWLLWTTCCETWDFGIKTSTSRHTSAKAGKERPPLKPFHIFSPNGFLWCNLRADTSLRAREGLPMDSVSPSRKLPLVLTCLTDWAFVGSLEVSQNHEDIVRGSSSLTITVSQESRYLILNMM